MAKVILNIKTDKLLVNTTDNFIFIKQSLGYRCLYYHNLHKISVFVL